jgi:hypothetical protein
MSVVVMAVGPVVMAVCLHLMPVRMPMFIIRRPVAVVMVAVSMAVSVSMGYWLMRVNMSVLVKYRKESACQHDWQDGKK